MTAEPPHRPRWMQGAGNVMRRVPRLAVTSRREPGAVPAVGPAPQRAAGLGSSGVRPGVRLEAGHAVLHVLRGDTPGGREGYRLHGWCGDLTVACPPRIAAPAVTLANLRQDDGLYPSEVLRGIKRWSAYEPALARWFNGIRARHGADLRLIVWDDTGYELPWELFWLPPDPEHALPGGPLGAVVVLSRWTTVHDVGQGLPRAMGDCHGRVLGYLHKDMADDDRVFTPYARRLHLEMTPFLQALDTAADRIGLVYLGCHGTYGRTVTRLTLGDRTWAELDDETMHGLRRDGALVCLNACHSGRFVGNEAQGEQALRGFAELFLRKGAGGCIVTSGKVGDPVARALVRRLVHEVAAHPRRPVTETLRVFRAHAVGEFGSLADLPRVRNDDGEVDSGGQKRVLRLLYAFMFHYYGHPRTALRLTTRDGWASGGGGGW